MIPVSLCQTCCEQFAQSGRSSILRMCIMLCLCCRLLLTKYVHSYWQWGWFLVVRPCGHSYVLEACGTWYPIPNVWSTGDTFTPHRRLWNSAQSISQRDVNSKSEIHTTTGNKHFVMRALFALLLNTEAPSNTYYVPILHRTLYVCDVRGALFADRLVGLKCRGKNKY